MSKNRNYTKMTNEVAESSSLEKGMEATEKSSYGENASDKENGLDPRSVLVGLAIGILMTQQNEED